MTTAAATATMPLATSTERGVTVVEFGGSPDSADPRALAETLQSVTGQGARDVVVDALYADNIDAALVDLLLSPKRWFGQDRGRFALVARSHLLQSLRVPSGNRASLLVATSVEEARKLLVRSESCEIDAGANEGNALLREWLRSNCASLEITEREAIEAASCEAFANASAHGSPGKDARIRVRLYVGSSVTVEVDDQGPGFEARQYFMVDPDALHEGARGLGIFIMRNLMEQVEFISRGEDDPGTTVRLIKRRSAARPCGGKKASLREAPVS